MPLRFINPNYHVILIHYPLGVFVLGVILELLSFMWRNSSVRIAARWMIVLGALFSLPAATSGIYALYDVRHNQHLDTPRYHMLRLHVIFMGIASLLAVFCAVVGVGASDRWRKRLYLPLLLGVVAAWGLMVVGAWHGGETIYQHGTSVAIIKLKVMKDADDNVILDADGKKVTQTALVPLEQGEHSLKDYDDVVKYYIGGILQQHLIVAGVAFAVAMGALGLSIRRVNAISLATVLVEDQVVVGAGGPPQRVTDQLMISRSFNPDSRGGIAGIIPSGRFWLLTLLLMLTTAGIGYWLMTGQSVFTHGGLENFKGYLAPDEPTVKVNRHLAHLILAGAMVGLALICALLAGVAPRNSALLMFFGTLLVLVIAAQVWIGVLLTFDREGPLTKFKNETENKIPAVVTLPRHGAVTSDGWVAVK